jgi:hypothetical protein
MLLSNLVSLFGLLSKTSEGQIDFKKARVTHKVGAGMQRFLCLMDSCKERAQHNTPLIGADMVFKQGK